jgi:hypothetical protein
MPYRKEFPAVFAKLKTLFRPRASGLVVVNDTRQYYYLDTPWVTKAGKIVFFGGVRKGKRYVSFYLMPVYECPGLLKRMSPALKKHMQGKSCFNFTGIDPVLFRELAKLTKAGLAEFKSKYAGEGA